MYTVKPVYSDHLWAVISINSCPLIFPNLCYFKLLGPLFNKDYKLIIIILENCLCAHTQSVLYIWPSIYFYWLYPCLWAIQLWPNREVVSLYRLQYMVVIILGHVHVLVAFIEVVLIKGGLIRQVSLYRVHVHAYEQVCQLYLSG